MTIQANTNTEITEELALLEECTANILSNINRAINRQKEPPNKVSQLVAMKWFIENNLKEETN